MSLLLMLLACFFAPAPPPRPTGAYLGVDLGPNRTDLTIRATFISSPAHAVNLMTGDVLVSLDGKKLRTHEDVAAFLKSKKPGTTATVVIRRDNAETTVQVTLAQPFPAHLGIFFQAGRLQIGRFSEDSAAKKAGLQVSDVIVAFDGAPVATAAALVALLKTKKAGNEVTITVRRNGEEVKVPVKLGKRPGY